MLPRKGLVHIAMPAQRWRLKIPGRGFDCGTIVEDDRLHAVERLGAILYALCRAGRIRFTVPSPFDPRDDAACPDCREALRAPA